jgi:hypothetical protein
MLRVRLERFVPFPEYGAAVRPYMIRRIGELSQGPALAGFLWSSGGRQENSRPWQAPPVAPGSHALPTDAELVMHVFSSWLDMQTPGSESVGVGLFSRKYVRKVGDLPKKGANAAPCMGSSPCRLTRGGFFYLTEFKHWTIVMSERFPPHFQLGQGRNLYNVHQVCTRSLSSSRSDLFLDAH